MPNVQVRNLPEEVHAELIRRAERAGKSLQQFLAEKLELIATTPTLEAILNRVEGRPATSGSPVRPPSGARRDHLTREQPRAERRRQLWFVTAVDDGERDTLSWIHRKE